MNNKLLKSVPLHYITGGQIDIWKEKNLRDIVVIQVNQFFLVSKRLRFFTDILSFE
jgi:hypothetical protein